jgi:hypothetical protein
MEQIMEDSEFTVIYIAQLTRIEQIFYFFNVHQNQHYSSLYVTKYIWETFDLPEDKTFEQLYREVCGNLSSFYTGTRLHFEKNFDREDDLSYNRNMYIYQYVPNHTVHIPQGVIKHGPVRCKIQDVKPLQQKLQRPQTKSTNLDENTTPKQLKFKYDENLFPLYEDEEPTEEPTEEKSLNDNTSEEISDIRSFQDLFKLLQPNHSINIKMNEDNTITFKKIIEG